MSELTPERSRYHELLTAFAPQWHDGAIIYDIGRTHAHEYREWFPRQTYISIDRSVKAAPSILCDIEKLPQNRSEFGIYPGDGLLCNGVTESATDPFAMVRGCFSLLKNAGNALFGIRLIGYPQSENHDLTRFTPAGAIHLVESAGFEVLSKEFVKRDGVPSYAFLDCWKK